MDPLATLASIMSIVGYSKKIQSNVGEWYGKNRNLKDESKNSKRYRILRSIFENNIDTRLILDYYRRKPEGDDSYFYRYTVDGKDVITNSLTRPCWNNRIINLSLSDQNYSLVDKVLEPNLPEIPSTPKLISIVGLQDLKFSNRPIYSMTHFKFNEHDFHSEFALIDFFTYRFTIGLVDTELYEAIISAGRSIEAILERKLDYLPIREMMLPSRSAILNPGSRICAGGVFVVFAVARPKPEHDYCLITHIRSSAVSDNQNSISVIPRAYHQHMINRRIETNILRTVFREIYEELFDGKEVEGTSKHVNPDYYFSKSKALRWLRDNPNEISIDLVSYGFNGLTGNYEYGILFAIHNPCFYEEFWDDFKLNWESEEADYHSSADREHLSKLLCDKNWATETIPPMIESLKRLKVINPGCVDLPEIQSVND